MHIEKYILCQLHIFLNFERPNSKVRTICSFGSNFIEMRQVEIIALSSGDMKLEIFVMFNQPFDKTIVSLARPSSTITPPQERAEPVSQ